MEKEIAHLISSIPAIVIGLTQAKEVVWWNSQAEEILGKKAAEVIGTPFDRCDLKWDWPAVQMALSRCQAEAQPIQMDMLRFRNKEGEERLLGLTIKPIDNGLTRHLRFTIIGEDHTDRRKMEHQLAQAQKMEALGLLAAGIAHEISTPAQFVGDNTRFIGDAFEDLIQITGGFKKLLEAVKATASHTQLVEKIQSQIKNSELDYLLKEIPAAIEHIGEGVARISKIVHSMKMFSHPGGKEYKLLNINEAIENTVTITRNEWKYTAEVITDLDGTLPMIPCLRGEINQALLNLMANAAHAISETHRFNSVEKGTITISSRKIDQWAEIRVSDTGVGIPAESQDQVFDLFFTTKEEGQGSGQGLAIAHSAIVDKHHGHLTFESQPDHGTTFIIRIPLQQEDVAFDS
jgi:PAS domain S-box-containing protein